MVHFVAAFCKARAFFPGRSVLVAWRAGIAAQTACKRTAAGGMVASIAGDKTTLALPESPSLWKRFGAHKGQQGIGAIAVELCCLFDLVSRAPLRFVYGKACTSEHKLIHKLIQGLKKGDLLLLDTGSLLRHFHENPPAPGPSLFPLRQPCVPRCWTFGPGDYLCQIKDSHNKPLSSSGGLRLSKRFSPTPPGHLSLDPILFPASNWPLSPALGHRDFLPRVQAYPAPTSWHCQTPTSFHQNSSCT
jgi:hypothetical protein